MSEEMEHLRYPVGKLKLPQQPVTSDQREQWIGIIAGLPARLRDAVSDFDAERWETPYRPGGWTVRQLVHHIADSHLNAYTRFKLALTEDEPTIKPYDEAAWAELPDVRDQPSEVSLQLIAALHSRWASLLRSLSDADFRRTLFHPEQKRRFDLDELTAMYAWHCEHHLAHVERLRERSGWALITAAAEAP